MLEATVRLPQGVRTIRIEAAGSSRAIVQATGAPPQRGEQETVRRAVEHLLRLDEDLSGFYERASSDPALAWATAGAGRLVRSQTVFEDVVKTICTTNCAWSATERMVKALVEHLGERAPGAPPEGPSGHAFPTPEAMATVEEAFYRGVVRAGYRSPSLHTLSTLVAGGSVDLERLVGARDLSNEELEATLRRLPGVGPYAAAHVMMLLGRYSRLVLDSWTRPKYARLVGRQTSDEAIARRFRRYRDHAGLAFWLFLTRDWIADGPPSVGAEPSGATSR